jgi:antitoxin (DNA-binding transcriptional repressor) of toxin-antitoxin stability system
MHSVGVFEAKNHFSELLERVQNGEVVTITKHGKPIAELRRSAEIDPALKAQRLALLEEIMARKAAFVAAGGVLKNSAAETVREARDEHLRAKFPNLYADEPSNDRTR